jgi:hypothetical protein
MQNGRNNQWSTVQRSYLVSNSHYSRFKGLENLLEGEKDICQRSSVGFVDSSFHWPAQVSKEPDTVSCGKQHLGTGAGEQRLPAVQSLPLVVWGWKQEGLVLDQKC